MAFITKEMAIELIENSGSKAKQMGVYSIFQSINPKLKNERQYHLFYNIGEANNFEFHSDPSVISDKELLYENGNILTLGVKLLENRNDKQYEPIRDVENEKLEIEKSKSTSSCLAPQIEELQETVTDIDGNLYHTIKIGKQVWMVENLKVTNLNDGTPIPYCKEYHGYHYVVKILGLFPIRKTSEIKWYDLKTPAFCHYNHDKANKSKFGSLYNWFAINSGKLAPTGWHVPTDVEWNELQDFLIINGYNWDGSKEGNKIAKSLASKNEWKNIDREGAIGNDLMKNNLSSFTAVPGGCRYDNEFKYIGDYGNWWSATENSSDLASSYTMYYYNCEVFRGSTMKNSGYSVRCVKD